MMPFYFNHFLPFFCSCLSTRLSFSHSVILKLCPSFCYSAMYSTLYSFFFFFWLSFCQAAFLYFCKALLHPAYSYNFFLVSDTQFFKRLCPSVHPLVREPKSKSAKTSILDAFCVCEWITWGVDGGCKPLPTCTQRYCDPASLVLRSKDFAKGTGCITALTQGRNA